MATNIGEYVPYVPATVRVLSIGAGGSTPILSAASGGPNPESAIYDVDGSSYELTLRIKPSASAIVETPLAMCEYVTVDDDRVYEADTCREATLDNVCREQHNSFVVKLLNAVVTRNGLGTSAGKVTCPNPPVDYARLRMDAIKKLTADKPGTTKRAIEFLARRSLYCGRDYKYDDAFETANDKSFLEACIERAKAGKVRVRLEGCPPSWWDGSSPQDSAGNYVAWKRGDGHTFLTPSLLVVRAASGVVYEEPDTAAVPEEKKAPSNAFDSLLFPPKASSRLLTNQ